MHKINATNWAAVEIQLIIATQKAGQVAAYIDTAHKVSINDLRLAGVDIERLLVSQPDTPQQAGEIVEVLAKSGAVQLIICNGPCEIRDGVEAAAMRTNTTIIFAVQTVKPVRPTARPCINSLIRQETLDKHVATAGVGRVITQTWLWEDGEAVVSPGYVTLRFGDVTLSYPADGLRDAMALSGHPASEFDWDFSTTIGHVEAV